MALKNISLQIHPAEFVAVIGKSGSGKSTLMNVLTGIDRVDSGEIIINKLPIHSLDEANLTAWRGKNIGIIFQFFQLLPTLTVAENIMLAMDFCQTYPPKTRRPRALSLLEKLGILEQADKLPSALSGGQQQRAAIARALANDPAILVADEPTGNLDTETALSIMRLFSALVSEGKTVVMVTHERDYRDFFSRTINLSDGQLDGQLLEPLTVATTSSETQEVQYA
ncbi:ABC transporter ATP-binding protein [Undibacterium sp.]|uniref:ABC transporter ATP-binding protein n=1 Tax=Undibacterium sp. TaxID=1914977 RepID=UPI0037517672